MSTSHAVVVGGGIAGLAAARMLARDGVRVTVLEGSPRIGGKLQVSEIAGIPVDEGAESMLARRPEGLDLVAALGRSGELVDPGTTSSSIYSRGELRPIPSGQVMGVPSDLRALAAARVLSPGGLARVPLDLVLPETRRGADVSVADFIGARVGREVVDRLVEPLLGGVYAGRAELLSFDATLPAVAAAARSHRSLLQAVQGIRDAAPKDPGPVFATLPDGLGTLPHLVAADVTAAGGTIRTGATVRELRRRQDGWRLTLGPTRAPEHLDADAVLIAVPAAPASRLLQEDVPDASRELAGIEYASMAIVTLAYRATAFPRLPAGSGYLVPAVESAPEHGGRGVKAVTFSSVKWPHLRDRDPEVIAVRCSIGRFGDERALQRTDAELAATAMAELAATCGVSELPVETRVTRWGGGLPQYNVGHADRVARVRSAVAAAPGLAVAGAAYDGLGIPACIASARAAATRVLDHLRSREGADHDAADGQAQGTRTQ
ncbi:protoporphyrinogen oxidase [Actinomadura livida]|uniref:Coproporphyrinogen III oxidase n=1 Tax=Actinomadura livida TaxID=79909 RepID=A0A7W7ICL4_9ACTN|nr:MULTISPECIES: protoporphyrinogen oxidase [Actinomadura]MBB4774243.1 oxygen-dependent protoporphyrinogen oxidase [Actinomadura catellatispora]GGT83946.1 protoporphyrinogen oxidase [Actinomadura livida]